jgi:hypothetical protein
MLSGPNDEHLSKEFPSFKPLSGCREVLDVTPASATSVAPKGRVISDLAQTIMTWEADCLEDDSISDDISVGERQTETQPPGKTLPYSIAVSPTSFFPPDP